MSTVDTSILIAASRERVWRTVMDPDRLADWVTIHRRLRSADRGDPHKGARMSQALHLRGTSIRVDWELVECEPQTLAVWEGHGPAHSRARTEYRLADAGPDRTRFDYHNAFRAPLGPLGAIASRALVGGMPEREATRSLARLKALLED